MLTELQLKEALPARMYKGLTKDTLENVNNAINDPVIAEVYRENIIGYSNVLENGQYKLKDYFNAVRYATFKLGGRTNQAAWKMTFPERYQELMAQGADNKKVAAYTAMYNKNKLVQAIMEQTLIPFHVINADARQEALDRLVGVIRDDDTSPKVVVEAANAILNHTKAPETAKVEVDIAVKEVTGLQELRELTDTYAKQQQEKIINGEATVTEIAESQFIEVAND